MANTVIALRSSGVTGNTPSLGVLANGELSLNFADGILYYKSSSNTLGSIRTTQVAGLNTEVQFNDSGSFGSNSNFTFNKAIATLNVKNINVSTNLVTTNLTATYLTTGSGAGGSIAGANVIYSNTFIANTGGITTAGNSSLNGIVTINYNVGATSSQNVAIEMYGANTKGGTGYFDFLAANNISGGSSNRNKWFRIDSNGKFQIINSLYTAAIFDLNDSGYLTVPGGIATSQYIQFSDGSKQYTANAGGGSSLSNNQILAGLQTVSSSANITFDWVAAANNGQGYNFKVGDDTWIGDINVADTMSVRGQQNVQNAYISFGNNDGLKLGRAGSGPLTYNGGIATTQYIQFSDGTKQYTANAGSGSFGTDSFARTQANAAFDKANTAYSTATTAQSTADSAASTAAAAYNTYDLASIYTPNNSTTVSATGRSDTFNFIGDAGIYVYSNATTKTVTFAGGIQSLPGANGMTVDYGYVTEAVYYNIDYGTI